MRPSGSRPVGKIPRSTLARSLRAPLDDARECRAAARRIAQLAKSLVKTARAAAQQRRLAHAPAVPASLELRSGTSAGSLYCIRTMPLSLKLTLAPHS